MGTCLQPGVNKVIIYASIIDQIYQQGQIVIIPESADPYQVIYQRVSKKGLYRKLSDHLTSHKNHVNSTMMKIFTYVKQKKKDRNCYYIHLSLIDEMVKNFQSFVDQGPLDKKKQVAGDLSSRDEYINKEIQSKFETIFFQMVAQIFDSFPQIRKYVLRSIIRFVQKQRMLKNPKLVWQITDRVLDSLADNSLIQIASQAYSVLIDKNSTDLIRQQRSQQGLQTFLELKLESRNQTIGIYCETILRIFIQNCLTSRDYNFIYNAVFSLADKYLFDETKIQSLQCQLFEIVQKQDFKDIFCKGIFKYLISYVCVCHNNKYSNKWENGIFDISYAAFKAQYPNILNRQVKMNAFKTILRWINSGIIDVNEFITYSRTSLMFYLVSNVCAYLQDRTILEMTVETFFQIYMCCNNNSKITICLQLFDQIHYSQPIIQQQTSIFVRIAKKVLEDLALIKMNAPQFSLFCPIENQLPNKTKIQLIQLGCLLLDCFTTPYDVILIESICGFIYSFQNFLETGTLKQKHQLACSMVSFFKKLSQKKQPQFLVVFLQKYLKMKQQFKTPGGIFFSGYLILELGQLLIKKSIVSSNIRKLNLKIYCTYNEDLQQQIINYLQKFPNDFYYPILDQIQITDTKSLKHIQLITKQFQKWQKNNQQQQLNFATTDFNYQRRKSWTSNNNNSFKTDESFKQIYEMINLCQYRD